MTEIEKLRKAYLKLEKANLILEAENIKNKQRNTVLQEDLKNTRFTLNESVLDITVKKDECKVLIKKLDKAKLLIDAEVENKEAAASINSGLITQISTLQKTVKAEEVRWEETLVMVSVIEDKLKDTKKYITGLEEKLKVSEEKCKKTLADVPGHLAEGAEVEPGVRVYGSKIAIEKCRFLMNLGKTVEGGKAAKK